MNRTAVLVLATAFVLSACIPLPFPVQATPTPFVDSLATDAALAATLAAGTFNALPTPTQETATFTLPPAAMDTDSPTATGATTQILTLTLDPNSTATNTITATLLPATVTAAVQTSPAATETLHPRFFGTLPPAIPFGKIGLINKAKAEVYVSLQCKTIDGHTTIIEYPVRGRFEVSAPAGRYTYVAWVGGRQFQGSFRLDKGEDLSITFNRDKVTIK